MQLLPILFIAVGLSMDAFAVSIASGSAYRQMHVKHALLIAAFFGVFQAFMPLLGSLAGFGLKGYITSCDHWIAFGLLSAVGGKMIYESSKIRSVEENADPSNTFVLLALSVATSIDALAVGITLSFITRSIGVAATIIGLITFVLSYLGVFIGKRFGHFFENKIEIVGGLILIVISVKILVEHLFF